jgi:hypothetical protein
MATTLSLIATQTLSSAASSVTFTSIPATYADLKIIGSFASAGGSAIGGYITFNGTSSNYTDRYMQGVGNTSTTVNSGSNAMGTNRMYFGVAQPSSSGGWSNIEIYVSNYAGSTNKSVNIDEVAGLGSTSTYQQQISGQWANSAAITSLALALDSVNMQTGTTFSLYGIKKS